MREEMKDTLRREIVIWISVIQPEDEKPQQTFRSFHFDRKVFTHANISLFEK